MFVENITLESIDILKGLSHVVVFTGTEKQLTMRIYKIVINNKLAQEKSDNQNAIQLVDIGPQADFEVRREKWANDDIWKIANKRPKVAKKKEDKNISYDAIGNKEGKVFVDKQNLDVMALRKRKKLKDSRKNQERNERLINMAEVNENNEVDNV